MVSKWVRVEVLDAVENHWGRIVPVVREPCEPRSLNLLLGLIQHIDCTDPSLQAGAVSRKVLALWGLA